MHQLITKLNPPREINASGLYFKWKAISWLSSIFIFLLFITWQEPKPNSHMFASTLQFPHHHFQAHLHLHIDIQNHYYRPSHSIPFLQSKWFRVIESNCLKARCLIVLLLTDAFILIFDIDIVMETAAAYARSLQFWLWWWFFIRFHLLANDKRPPFVCIFNGDVSDRNGEF